MGLEWVLGGRARLRILALFVLASIFVGGCFKPSEPSEVAKKSAPSSPPPEYPLLVVDEEHEIRGTNELAYRIRARLGVGIEATNFHFADGAAIMPPAYQISATPGIRIDATKIQITDGTNSFSPNMVQLIGNESLYRLASETETNFYTVDYYKLETVGGDSFRGFKPGDHFMLAIGRGTNTFHDHKFWVMWAGHIEVK